MVHAIFALNSIDEIQGKPAAKVGCMQITLFSLGNDGKRILALLNTKRPLRQKA